MFLRCLLPSHNCQGCSARLPTCMLLHLIIYWAGKASWKVVLYMFTKADQLIWGSAYCAHALLHEAHMLGCVCQGCSCLTFGMLHMATIATMTAVMLTSSLSCLQTTSFVPVCSHVAIPAVALGQQSSHFCKSYHQLIFKVLLHHSTSSVACLCS